MPRARRHQLGQAAGSLTASRLPLGTPSFTSGTSPDRSRQTTDILVERPREAALYSSHSSFDSDTTTDKSDSRGSSRANLAMTSAHSYINEQALSLAAAKLERQKRRIEDANAALTTQFPSEKHKQTARNKGKIWKPFDFATDINAISQTHIDNAPVVETRINVFRAPSQGAALSRPVSRISTNTHNSTASDPERRDSQFLESDDFQLFLGRRKSRPAVSTFDDKSSAQNATVEAAFSKRDITEVFGNELPRSGFMDGNPGTVDGQLQFIQHPNGDVSAHQWSSSRFGWENIGQFSNIRKKIEGQLAADRLKGETAWQSLQQNTLAYFRTVAKQREADVMRLPFGPREIAASLPDTRPPSAAPTGPRRITSKVEMPERPETMMPRQEIHVSHSGVTNRDATAAIPAKPPLDSLPHLQSRSSQPSSRFNPALNFTPTTRGNVREDPFTSSNPPSDVYRSQNSTHELTVQHSFYQPWLNPMSYAYVHPWFHGNGSISYQTPYEQMSYKDRCSPSNPTTTNAQNVRLNHHAPSHQQTQEQFARSVTQQALQQPIPSGQLQDRLPSCNYPAPFTSISTGHAASTISTSGALPQPKASTALESRTAMREHVMKMGEHAKERTKSQANIGRTVLYDPFQDQNHKDPTPSEPTKEEVPAAAASQSEMLGHFPSLGLSMIPGLSTFSRNNKGPFPTALAPSVKLPPNDASAHAPPYKSLLKQTSGLSECDLRDSSPDREWERRNLDNNQENHTAINRTSSLKQWDTDQLDEWLWSGNKFARQEDFHQRIMATDALSIRRTHSTNPSTKPIAPPGRFKPQQQTVAATSQSNILTNRLLVPVLENLASYVQGPVEKRRDYFCPWVKAPDWAIDRGANGNDSFFDSQWGQPPARVGRDPRYQPLPRGLDVRFGNFEAPRSGHSVAMPSSGLDRRFGYEGRF